jgi:hypothetical protein
LGHSGGRKLTISRGNSQLNVSHNLLVVPGEEKVFFGKFISKTDCFQFLKVSFKQGFVEKQNIPIPGVEPGPAG